MGWLAMFGVRLIIMLGLLAVCGGQGFAQVGSDCVKGSSVSAASMDAHNNIASTEHPAQIGRASCRERVFRTV